MKISKVIPMLALLLTSFTSLNAEEIRVAVASNFVGVIKEIANRFEKQSRHKIVLIVGSTGKHYAQIRNGAPFDVFFAADEKRPALLEKNNIAIPSSRFTYAIGKLVLWSPDSKLIDNEGEILKSNSFRYLSIANPKLAPYGKAAQQVLEKHDLWETLKGKMVRGENINQAFQFIKTGNAELGFIAYSQIKQPGLSIPMEGSFWEIPSSLYEPIKQQAVLLKDNQAAQRFLEFVKTPEVLNVISDMGYGVPYIKEASHADVHKRMTDVN